MIFPIVSILFSGIILMAVPLSVYRGVSIARPFSYKRIMTRNKIIVMIIALWIFAVITALPNLDYHLVFVPSLAVCAVVEVDPVIAVIYLVPGVLSFLFILCASAYLRYKIIKSNRFVHGVQRSALDREKALRAGRLVDALMEQVKPTMSVLITGGIDGLFDLFLIVVFGILSALSSPATMLLVIETVLFGLNYCQLLCHPLCFGLYSKEIRTIRRYERSCLLVIIREAV